MKKVHAGEDAPTQAPALPERVQAALGELLGAAREGLLALSVGVGLGVMHELMAEEVEEVCGPRGKHDPERVAYRHGSDDGEVTLGSRRVGVQRPRMRAKDGGGEVTVETYEHFASRDALSAVVLERMLAGVSTRRFGRTQEPVGDQVEGEARCTSKSAVSRTFVARTAETLRALMSRRLEDVRLAVLMLDGIVLKDHTNVVALGITTEGVKVPLGLWEGSTENKTIATSLLSDLVDRGLDVEQGVLVVIDGSKALRAAVNAVLGPRTPVHRCVRHKERNVLDHLPERDRPEVKRRLRRAWARDDHRQALTELQALAAELERSHPGAASSLKEGMQETLTVTRLGVQGALKRTLQSTNPCESMVRHEAPYERRERTKNSHPCRLEGRPRADAAARRSWGQPWRGIAR
jgi:putative transposase